MITFILLTSTLSALIYEGSALLCIMCASVESWGHCEENRIVVNCSSVDPDFDVCFKVHRATKIGNSSERHIYSKGCAYQELCNGKQCAEYGDWCLVDCCNLDRCNASPGVEVTYLTPLLAGISIAVHLSYESRSAVLF